MSVAARRRRVSVRLNSRDMPVAEIGRGDRKQPLSNFALKLVRTAFSSRPVRFTWREAQEIAARGYDASRKGAPRSRSASLHSQGFKTCGHLTRATGVSKSALHRWNGQLIPRLPTRQGFIALTDIEFAEFTTLILEARNRRKGAGKQPLRSTPPVVRLHSSNQA